LESKAIERSERAQKKSRPTAISSKKRQNKETSLKERGMLEVIPSAFKHASSQCVNKFFNVF
jgi:hypothetical protein